TLVGDVDVDDELRPEQPPGAAAVLVHAGADVGPGRRHLFRLAAPRAPHQGAAPALGGAPLRPPDGAVGGDRRAAQPPAAARHVGGRDRRAPGSIGSDRGHQMTSSPGGLATTLVRSGSPPPTITSASTSRSAPVSTS